MGAGLHLARRDVGRERRPRRRNPRLHAGAGVAARRGGRLFWPRARVFRPRRLRARSRGFRPTETRPGRSARPDLAPTRQERAGATDSREEFAAAIASRKSDAWPAPLLQVFQGQRSASSLEAAATDPQQRCEAQFYGGEWSLLQGAREAAASAFKAAAAECPRFSVEFRMAALELRRMQGAP